MDIRTSTERIADNRALDHAYAMGRNAFVNLALAEGYVDRAYWSTQYAEYAKGNRGPYMHDFTLANLGRGKA